MQKDSTKINPPPGEFKEEVKENEAWIPSKLVKNTRNVFYVYWSVIQASITSLLYSTPPHLHNKTAFV